MKKDSHPTYYGDAKIICSCGHVWMVGSTKKELHVEICSNCHPFYTGKKKLFDTAGKVEKFKAREEKTKALQEAKNKRNAGKSKKTIEKRAKSSQDKKQG